ncbi:serine/threonine-protein kinase [Actinomadura violacea]|uniref:Serine/threonine protein kinase n=1 Tax=Actinomadura violacea TaxID=2819934 RepID=A0ABS3RM85_9ACTN|nr:serine/threonine-protein kinase [Actinomadura violacea]MBO2457850.1 serine/threonine protein kinase [Actinomadura violacea]
MRPLRPTDPRRIGRLGSGGSGQVYLARSPGGRPVAVKVVHGHLAASERFRTRFAREAAAARRVGGFHTAQVVDLAPDADPPWLVTAYVPGPSLRDAVQEHGPLPPAMLTALGAGLAEGPAAVHAAGLVHRDLKPGNVVLAADGPRIIDFGIAHALDASELTASGAVLGTPAYMSPEQARAEAVGPLHRTWRARAFQALARAA